MEEGKSTYLPFWASQRQVTSSLAVITAKLSAHLTGIGMRDWLPFLPPLPWPLSSSAMSGCWDYAWDSHPPLPPPSPCSLCLLWVALSAKGREGAPAIGMPLQPLPLALESSRFFIRYRSTGVGHSVCGAPQPRGRRFLSWGNLPETMVKRKRDSMWEQIRKLMTRTSNSYTIGIP